jgi:hypothetical protein
MVGGGGGANPFLILCTLYWKPMKYCCIFFHGFVNYSWGAHAGILMYPLTWIVPLQRIQPHTISYSLAYNQRRKTSIWPSPCHTFKEISQQWHQPFDMLDAIMVQICHQVQKSPLTSMLMVFLKVTIGSCSKLSIRITIKLCSLTSFTWQ